MRAATAADACTVPAPSQDRLLGRTELIHAAQLEPRERGSASPRCRVTVLVASHGLCHSQGSKPPLLHQVPLLVAAAWLPGWAASCSRRKLHPRELQAAPAALQAAAPGVCPLHAAKRCAAAQQQPPSSGASRMCCQAPLQGRARACCSGPEHASHPPACCCPRSSSWRTRWSGGT